MLLIPDTEGKPTRAATYFNDLHTDSAGSKLRHFREIHRKTGIPYEQMHRNFEVEDLGVTMQFVKTGVDRKTFEEGLALWRQRRGIKVQRE
ncbi:hypothetical protein A1Q1_01221 [Trichosporon asahii var. asahii CBS 2479]|uniref:Uncharacterized protein n=1 Tax=Trichosporon asahii var. asahii (strain ATCC 90039 / CBS 2479 / JCM 2466 / KCTC 7840 / NBRC 103889/ NCYC 2677 / UAMH 7654) TaxID=1186058 RepID=J6F315_TRIAS|nr:hypothetical protein A1Q1_01221 [Trichosporon asahii var. asahii CBS 2479]EJT49592.1 hypothetical protein A1Q1_01221 [Trichosporon asahii var. asahii CBS 2479]